MMLEINGEMRCLPCIGNVEDLLKFLGLGLDRIAVEVNRRILRRHEWDRTPINDLDKIEIVQFVGGG